jgi:Flp pilus assembly pilin Flp
MGAVVRQRIRGDRKSIRALRSDTRGAAMVEYVVLVGTLGLVLMAALLTSGPAMLRDFIHARNTCTSPFP